jgi:predicted amidohydrolase
MTQLTVAAAQIECRPSDIQANLALHLEMIAAARLRGVDLLQFSELSLCDYVSVPNLAAVGMGRDDKVFARLADAAGDMAISVGFVERSGGHYYNAMALIVGGHVAAVHRKVNLPTYGNLVEGHHYQAGHAVELVEVQGWQMSTLVCADVWNPALPWIAALKGAELMLIPVASALGAVEGEFENPGGWDATLRQLAATYAMPVVMTNHCGRRGNLNFWGGSRILDPFGRELARAGAAPALIVAVINRTEMLLARERLPTVRDANPALIQKLLGEILPA